MILAMDQTNKAHRCAAFLIFETCYYSGSRPFAQDTAMNGLLQILSMETPRSNPAKCICVLLVVTFIVRNDSGLLDDAVTQHVQKAILFAESQVLGSKRPSTAPFNLPGLEYIRGMPYDYLLPEQNLNQAQFENADDRHVRAQQMLLEIWDFNAQRQPFLFSNSKVVRSTEESSLVLEIH